MHERTAGIHAGEFPQPPMGTAPAQPIERLDDPRALQLLTTEHWSLLATRSMSWTESFSRASMLLSALSATVVALALVAQVSAFGEGFVVFALIALPFVLFIGLTTFVRLGQASAHDLFCVQGMNRLRHAYLEVAPHLEPYFLTSRYDDWAGILVTLGSRPGGSSNVITDVLHFFVTMPGMIAVINSMVGAVIGGLIAVQLGGVMAPAIGAGAVSFVVVFVGQMAYGWTQWAATTRMPARFATPPTEPPE